MSARLLVLVALSLAVSGCAMGARTSAMTVFVPEEPLITEDSPVYHAIAVTSVTGGKATNPMGSSKVSNEDLYGAVEQSLRAHTMLALNEPARFELNVALVELDQPWFGRDVTVAVTVNYSLIHVGTGQVCFDEVVESQYTARFSNEPDGVARLRLANEGAVRENIEEFILLLISDVDTNPAFVAGGDGE